MFDRSIFKEFPLQLIIFFGLIYLGSHLSTYLLKYLNHAIPSLQLSDSATGMLLGQALSTIVLLLIPALICGWLFSIGNTKQYLYLNKPINYKIIGVSTLLIITAQPLINTMASLNQMISLPSSLSYYETLFRTLEQTMKIKMEVMLATNQIGGLLINLCVVAILAALAEELFFRGLVQRLAYTAVENKHVAVWVTAIIFSVMHLSFFEFIPRMILGAFLGYLVYYSGSIWPSVAVHVANNAFVVIVRYLELNFSSFRISHWGDGALWWIGLISLLSVIIIAWISIRQKSVTHDTNN